MANATDFRCQICESAYKVVRVEAALSANEHPLTCLSCDAPLRNREGKYVLKYFRVGGRPVTRGRRPLL
jgi:hypothetical protein